MVEIGLVYTRGILPEIEIRYEVFTQYALENVEKYVQMDEIL